MARVIWRLFLTCRLRSSGRLRSKGCVLVEGGAWGWDYLGRYNAPIWVRELRHAGQLKSRP